jgi:PAS domain S-box-containing protein
MSKQLHKVLEQLHDIAFYEIDGSGKVCEWSDTARQLLGFSSEEVMGRYLTELAERALTTAPLSALEEAAQKGRSETFGLLTRKDGSRFWANEVTLPNREQTGNLSGFAKIVRDVTSWKESQDDRDRIFDLSADLIGVCGFDGFFKRINPSFSRVLGYSDSEILSRPYTDFVHPDDLAATRAEADANEHGDGMAVRRSFQNRYRHADGTYRWFEWKVRPVLERQLIYFIARDVTEQKANEQQLTIYSAELERSNGELQQFAYVASHDLQEPLRAVVGCVEMLEERNRGNLDARSLELMGHIVEGAKRMQNLISDLLSYSRVGSKTINKAWIDVRGSVDKALRQLEAALQESHAVVKIDALPHAWADAAQLTQLFQNLIGNGIKFRTDRPPEVVIGAEENDQEIVFFVRDNGIGISPEFHGKLFGLFQRLNSRRQYAGTGIGLAICKKIVDRHGGRIWVESQLGQGASFKFSIPKGPKP